MTSSYPRGRAMSSVDWDELDFFNLDSDVEQDAKVKMKSKKRKWREIENIKEKRRLRKELEQYDSYSF